MTARHVNPSRMRLRLASAFWVGSTLAALACSGDERGALGSPGGGEDGATGPAEAAADDADSPGVADFDRPLGMPIGQGAASAEAAPAVAPTPVGDTDVAEVDLEIPALPPPEELAPCSGCVELNVDVNDINQRDSFVFSPGTVNVTRVVWTLVVPFNSDQLFVQPFVDNVYGTFTDLDANAFAVDTPVQLVHEYSGPASTVGLAVGSSGAWTGNMTMAVFVDSVTLEGADPAASRSFDADVGGLVVGSNAHNPQIVHHPEATE